jgi:hypothetical protein
MPGSSKFGASYSYVENTKIHAVIRFVLNEEIKDP